MSESTQNAEMEFRYVEFRADDNVLSGTVLRYGDTARIGRYRERFQAASLRWSDGEVMANIMHDRNQPVARLGSGLTLTDTGESIEARIDVPDTEFGRRALEMVRANILRGFSVEFFASRSKWDVPNTRTIQDARLVGIGLVDKPAYSDSQIEQRIWTIHYKNKPKLPKFYW